jgi:hypothetical protein
MSKDCKIPARRKGRPIEKILGDRTFRAFKTNFAQLVSYVTPTFLLRSRIALGTLDVHRFHRCEGGAGCATSPDTPSFNSAMHFTPGCTPLAPSQGDLWGGTGRVLALPQGV